MPEPKGERTGWDRLESLFAKASSIPVEERPAFLDAECAGNAELRREIDDLLACSDPAAGFFDRFRNAIGEPPSELADPLAGTMVGHYRIETRLGAGGMGVVYRAFDQRLQRPVALKLLSSHLSEDTLARRRFLTEARSAAALDHPNICTIHETGETESGQPFIAMAFCTGETLRTRIARGPVSFGEAANIALQMARGLAAAHARGIVHRDVKPANVMIGDDGVVKLVDFGLARLSDGTVTESGMERGTIAYMAPELLHGERADVRSDLWSLGVVLYELLTGVRPFRAESDAALVYAIVQEDPPSIASLRPDVPEPLRRIAEALLHKIPNERYADARAVVADLESFRGNAAQTPSPRLPRVERPKGLMRQWRRSWSIAAALTIVVAVVLSLVNLRDRQTAVAKSSSSLPRVAVMYFHDEPKDSLAAAVAAAVNERLIEALSEVPGLDVPSLNAMQPYRQRGTAVASIADGLAAGWLVGGFIKRDGDRLEVNGELADSTGRLLDSRRIQGSVREQPILLEETVEAIAVMLRARIGDRLRERRWREGTSSAPARGFLAAAMRHLQDANQLVERTQPHDTFLDLYLADSALARAAFFDPLWPEPLIERAWLGRRFAFQMFGLQVGQDSVRAALQRGVSQADAALALGKDSARALEIRGILRYARSLLLPPDAGGPDRAAQFALAENDLELAILGDSTLARALSTLSAMQYTRGDFERARLNAARAYRADYYLKQPEILFQLFNTSFEVGQDDEARKWCMLYNRRFPNDWVGAQCRLILMTWSADEPAHADTAWRLVEVASTKTAPAVRRITELQLTVLAAGVIARTVPGDSAARVLARVSTLASNDTRLSENNRQVLRRFEAGVRVRLNDRDGAIVLLERYLDDLPSTRAQLSNSRIFRTLFDDPRLRAPHN